MFEKGLNRLEYRYYILKNRRRIKSSAYASRTKKLIDKATKNLGNEIRETEEMARSFFNLLSHNLKLGTRKTPPTEEEVKEAIEQLKDVGRLSIFATISILPGGGFSLIGLELLARRFGIKNFTFVPSSFRKKVPVSENQISTGDRQYRI